MPKAIRSKDFRQHFLLERNVGDGKFEDETKNSGLQNMPLKSRRGAAFGDLNNDGLIDVIVTNLGEAPTVLLNNTENDNQKVAIKLIEKGKNKDAVGARITLKTDKRTMMQEVEAGASYLSQNDFRLHFGLLKGEKIETVEVRWSDGKTEIVKGILPDKITIITQNTGITDTSDFRSR